MEEMSVETSELTKDKTLREYYREDLSQFRGVNTIGGERRVLVANDRVRNQDVVVKVARTRTIRFEMTQEDTKTYPHLNTDGLSYLEMSAATRENLQNPEFKKHYNQDVQDRLNIARIAHQISPVVAEPLGFLKLQTGYDAEVYKKYTGKNAINTTDRAQSDPLSQEQRTFAQSQIKLLESNGLFALGDEYDENNILKTGDNPEDIVFIEPPVLFEKSRVKESTEQTQALDQIWHDYSNRSQQRAA